MRLPQGATSVDYAVNSSIASTLGLSGQQTNIQNRIVSAANAWRNSSRLTPILKTTGCTRPNNPTQAQTRCWLAQSEDPGARATTHTWRQAHPNYHTISGAYVGLNSDLSGWNLNGVMPGDIFSVVIHEWGHLLGLGDNPNTVYGGGLTNTVMKQGLPRSGLFIDDKTAVTMMYGPRTQFEVDQFLGLHQVIPEPRSGTFSHANCSVGFADYWTYSPGSEGIPASPSGGRVMRFQGCAVNNGSSPNYAYMDFSSYSSDGSRNEDGSVVPACGSICYFQIRSNTKIRWEQFNASNKCWVSIDIQFTDGTWLRDYGHTDTNGRGTHPAARGCHVTPQGSWFTVTIDLGNFAGKFVRRWSIGYDYAHDHGQWRTYFDNIRIE